MSGTRLGAIKGWQTRRREGHANPAKQPDKAALQARAEKLRQRMIVAHGTGNTHKAKQAEDAYFKAAHKERNASLKLSIRKHTYNGVDGYLLYGGGRGIYGTKIFTHTREEAEHARERLKRGEDAFPPPRKKKR